MNMKLVNLTPHAITLVTSHGAVTVPPSGQVARCEQIEEPVSSFDCEGIPVLVVRIEYGRVEDLPEPVEGTGYIVSALVAAAVPGRHDVFGVAQPVRDSEGRVTGCRALSVR